MHRGILAGGVMVGILLTAPSSYAESLHGISAHPVDHYDPQQPWFYYQISSGQTIRDRVVISNNNDDPVTIRVYGVDAQPVRNGGLAMGTTHQQSTSVGRWLSPGSVTTSINGHKDLILPFTLQIPPRLFTHHYYGGIIIEPVVKQASLQRRGVVVVTRLGVRVYADAFSIDKRPPTTTPYVVPKKSTLPFLSTVLTILLALLLSLVAWRLVAYYQHRDGQ
jgi:hypothetical protein